jgi:hypothetical protein
MEPGIWKHPEGPAVHPDRLVAKGLVTRSAVPGNRRAVAIRLTKTAGLNTSDRRALLRTIKKLVRKISLQPRAAD